MIVKNVLNQCRIEEVVNALMSAYYIDDSKQDSIYSKHETCIEELNKLTPKQSEHIVFGVNFEEFGEFNLQLMVYKLSDLNQDFDLQNALESLRNIDTLSNLEIKTILAASKLAESHNILSIPWEEVLGYEVNEQNIIDIGAANFIAAILHEMTFFGFNKEESVIPCMQSENSSATVHKKDLISIEDLYKKLGIEDVQTSEEREQEERDVLIECAKNLTHTYTMLQRCI